MKKLLFIAGILVASLPLFAQRIGVDRVDIALSPSCTTLNAPSGKLTLCADSVSGLTKCFNSGGTSCFPSSGSGLADPGSNGIIKRTSLNTTAPAVAGADYVTPAGNVATATALAADPSACSTGSVVTDIAANGTLTCSPVKRQCTYIMDNGASVLADTDDKNDFCSNQLGYSTTIIEVVCKSDTGTPSMMVRKNGATSVLSGNLSCSTSGASTSSFASATFADNDWLDILTVTAGGAAHSYTVTVVYQ
jgi:hypothetical protein